MLSTHVERFCDNLGELKPLFDEHYKEVSVHRKHGIKLRPDYSKYELLEKRGELLFIALRRNGKIVGYFTGFIASALHYAGILQLGLDLIYVHPASRGKINGQNGGVLLRDTAILEAKKRGVKLFTVGFKSFRSKHMKHLLETGGFEPFEVHYALWIDDEK